MGETELLLDRRRARDGNAAPELIDEGDEEQREGA
jgi:hypothetical protein